MTMDLNCDLHLHSPFARGVSRRMTPEVLLAASAQKGIGAIGTGDALQPEWRKAWRPHLENDFGIAVLPTVEVQAAGRVHHLAFFPDFDAVEAFGDLLAPHGRSLGSEGRPHVHLAGGEVVRAAHDAGGLAGPSHAFTPWTGIYAAFDSIAACYGGEPIDFLELGLSADSSYGAGITELYGVPFISSSDAHSPELHRLGREFTRLNVDRPTPAGVLGALKRGDVALNVGLFPEEGKYNETACMRCLHHYSLAEAEEHGWRCPEDRTLLKKGVHDRARELSDGEPRPRPPYLHLIPLAAGDRRGARTRVPDSEGGASGSRGPARGLRNRDRGPRRPPRERDRRFQPGRGPGDRHAPIGPDRPSSRRRRVLRHLRAPARLTVSQGGQA